MTRLWRYNQRRVLSPAAKESILESDGYVCLYCLGHATEIDHFVPYSYGRSHCNGNLVSCCEECNRIASGHVFASLGEKTRYIMTKRLGRKWSQKLKRKAEYGYTDCGLSFRPCTYGATNFLCPECARHIEREK
jgi:hypothetical protein